MNDNVPLVSVILPTYNRAYIIDRAIKSVLDQTFTYLELIVVDDGSTDNTEEVVNSFKDPRIRFLCHETNRGASAARNTGIKASVGEYIAFNDSDDEWLPTKLEKQVKVFQENGNNNLGAVLCEYEIISTHSKQYIIPQLALINAYDILTRLDSQCGTPGFLFKRNAIEPELYFDENLPSCQDVDIILRLSRICQFDCVPEPLFRQYAHEGPRIWNSKRALEGYSLILKKYAKELKSRPKIRNYHHKNMAMHYYRYGDMAEVRRRLRYSIKAYPCDIGAYLFFIASLFGRRGLRYFIVTSNFIVSLLRRSFITQ